MVWASTPARRGGEPGGSGGSLCLAVHIVLDDRPALQPADDHVVERPRGVEARLAGHAGSLSPGRSVSELVNEGNNPPTKEFESRIKQIKALALERCPVPFSRLTRPCAGGSVPVTVGFPLGCCARVRFFGVSPPASLAGPGRACFQLPIG